LRLISKAFAVQEAIISSIAIASSTREAKFFFASGREGDRLVAKIVYN
jgi:hypothetical protein